MQIAKWWQTAGFVRLSAFYCVLCICETFYSAPVTNRNINHYRVCVSVIHGSRCVCRLESIYIFIEYISAFGVELVALRQMTAD